MAYLSDNWEEFYPIPPSYITHYWTSLNTIIVWILWSQLMSPICHPLLFTMGMFSWAENHRDDLWSKVLLVREALTVDWLPASAISMGGVSTLHHKARDDTLDMGWNLGFGALSRMVLVIKWDVYIYIMKINVPSGYLTSLWKMAHL